MHLSNSSLWANWSPDVPTRALRTCVPSAQTPWGSCVCSKTASAMEKGWSLGSESNTSSVSTRELTGERQIHLCDKNPEAFHPLDIQLYHFLLRPTSRISHLCFPNDMHIFHFHVRWVKGVLHLWGCADCNLYLIALSPHMCDTKW